MSDEQQARALLSCLKPVPDGDYSEAAESKRAALARLDSLIAQHRGARSRRFAGVLLVAAAALLVSGATWKLTSRAPREARLALNGAGAVRLGPSGATRTAAQVGALALGGELEVLDARGVEVLTPQGIALSLVGPARVGLGALGSPGNPELRLLSGAVSAVVPKLQPGQSFSISTPNARVVVHGTKLNVSWRAEMKETCVTVTDGVVSVTRAGATERLSAGQSSGCAALPPSAKAEVVVEPTPARSAAAEPSVRAPQQPPRAATRSKPASDSLARANRLLQAALQLEQQQQLGEAEKLLHELLATDPASPLAPEARDALQRIALVRRRPTP